MVLLEPGDRVTWFGAWGTQPGKQARILSIEEVQPGHSDGGVRVMCIEWKNDRSFVVDLDNGHWAYGFQIRPLEG